MVNLSELGNIEPLELSINLTNPDILNTAVESANTTTEGYFGLGIGIVLYLFLVYLATQENSLFGFDFVKASLFASGITITLMVVMLALDLISSYIHLMWFVVIFILSLMGSYFLKDSE